MFRKKIGLLMDASADESVEKGIMSTGARQNSTQRWFTF